MTDKLQVCVSVSPSFLLNARFKFPFASKYYSLYMLYILLKYVQNIIMKSYFLLEDLKIKVTLWGPLRSSKRLVWPKCGIYSGLRKILFKFLTKFRKEFAASGWTICNTKTRKQLDSTAYTFRTSVVTSAEDVDKYSNISSSFSECLLCFPKTKMALWRLYLITVGVHYLLILFSMYVCTNVCVSHSVVSDSLRPQNLYPPGFSAHEILQARILEWIAIPFSRGSSQPRDQTLVDFILYCFSNNIENSNLRIWVIILTRGFKSTVIIRLLFQGAETHLVQFFKYLCIWLCLNLFVTRGVLSLHHSIPRKLLVATCGI